MVLNTPLNYDGIGYYKTDDHTTLASSEIEIVLNAQHKLVINLIFQLIHDCSLIG